MLSMQFVSFTIIGTIFFKKNRYFGLPIYIVFIFIIYSKMLSYIQYTTVSMLCITAGLISLMYALQDMKNINKTILFISILMCAIGCMIRFSTIIIAVPFILIYFIFKIIKEKKLSVVKIFLLLFLVIILVKISFSIIYNINPIYKNFLKFNDVRTYLHDYNWMNYNASNKEIFDSVEWSKNDRDIFYAYCYGDEEFFNTETLEKLKQNALDNTKEINLLQKFSDTFNSFTEAIKNDTYKFIFMITTILLISNNLLIILKQEKDERNDTININFVNLTLITILGMHCLFIFLGRPMFRVVISIYIIGIALLMYKLIDSSTIKEGKIAKYFIILFIIIISFFELKQNVAYAQYYTKENYKVYKDIIEYTSSHRENAYLYTLVMHDRFLAYSVYEKIPDNSYENIRPLGDWDTYTKNYYIFKEKYNIDNLLESLYKNDNVYLISGNVIWEENYKEYINIITKYINEHYNVNVELEVIKEFENNIKIYKLYEIN